MATSAISAASSLSGTAVSKLSVEDLMRVLLTELTYQDPLKPVDNKDFMAQIAQFTALDATQQLNTNIEQLLSVQSMNQSVGLLGKTVSVTTSDGSSVKGKVSAITMSGGQPQLSVTTGTDGSGQTLTGISLSQVETVQP
jgi:flagellar basal-body rod modification protein FlgD